MHSHRTSWFVGKGYVFLEIELGKPSDPTLSENITKGGEVVLFISSLLLRPVLAGFYQVAPLGRDSYSEASRHDHGDRRERLTSCKCP